MGTIFKAGGLAGIAAALMAVVPPAATADQTEPTWNCRASAGYGFSASGSRFEPFLANGINDGSDRPACADDLASGLDVTNTSSPIKVRLQAPRAATRLEPDFGAARDQAGYSGAFIESGTVNVGGGLIIDTEALSAQASAICEAGVPTFRASSRVVRVTINGHEVPVEGVVTQVSTFVNGSPFSAVVKIIPNAEVRTADSLVRQALRIELFNTSGTPQGVVVLGEAKVAKKGDVCAAPAPPPEPQDSGTNSGGTNTGANTGETATTGSTNTGGDTNPGPSTNTATPITGSSTPTREVRINGRNGGCGRLQMYIARPRGTSYSGRFGERVVVRGRIVSCTGKPIIGARIDVRHIVDGKRHVKTGLRSRALGRLTLILPLNMTTRRVEFSYRGDLNSSRVNSRRTLRFTIRDRKGRILTGPGPGSSKATF